MAWDYADLAKDAKSAGGPEAYTDLLVQSGRDQMIPWIVGAGAVGTAGGILITKIVGYFKKRKNIYAQAVECAKQETIEGINQYNTENNNDSSDEISE